MENDSTPAMLARIASLANTALRAIFSWVIFPVGIVLILHTFVFQAYHVEGSSMANTLHTGDYLIVSKVSRSVRATTYLPARGQIIVFRYPKDPSRTFVKRVIALPGERIVIKEGRVTVFSNEYPEGFNPDTGYEPASSVTLIDTDERVQPGHIFVMGDNRLPNMSSDSRDWGEVPAENIIGEAKIRLLPLNGTRLLP
jgi:signal peptidase I